MLNQIVIQGRLTRDPEMRQTPGGTPICTFSLAVERDFKDKDGNRKVDFIDCVCWRGTAEFASKYFAKGRMALVLGSLQIRTYEKDGEKRRAAEILVSSLYFSDSKPQGEKPDYSWVADAEKAKEDTDEQMELDNELPF